MRATLLSSLGAVLSLGASGVLANVVCSTEPALGVASNATLSVNDSTQACIKQFCTTALEDGLDDTEGYASDRCGSIQLTITQIDDDLQLNVDSCVAQFASIIDQCTIGGHTLATEALYQIQLSDTEEKSVHERELSVDAEDDDEDVDEDEHSSLQARRASRSGGRSRTASTGRTRKTKTKAKTSKTTKTTKSKSKSKGQKGKGTATGTKSTKASATPKAQQCNQGTKKTKTKGKTTSSKSGKKTVRDIVDDFLPQVLRRNPTPPATGSGSAAGASCPIDTKHYIKKELERGRVWSYKFDSSAGWEQVVTDKRAQKVLKTMRADGVFNAVALQGSKSYCIGEPSGGTNPGTVTVAEANAGGKCLLTNGNYFVMAGMENLEWDVGGEVINNVEINSKNKFAVGFTTSTNNQVDVPSAHAQYYEKFTGDDGSSMMCGPGLKTPLNLNSPELQYWCKRTPETTEHALPHPTDDTLVRTVFSQIPGGVATSREPNERLVTVIMTENLKYVFTYTSRRSRGVDVNRMRDVIKIYLGEFLGANIRDAKQVLNFDGGGSIFVAWVKNGRYDVIAAGGLNGQKAGSTFRPRTVTTMVRHSIE